VKIAASYLPRLTVALFGAIDLLRDRGNPANADVKKPGESGWTGRSGNSSSRYRFRRSLPVAVTKDNVMHTVIKDGFQNLETIQKSLPPEKWPK
jgi:hypothetical protein